MGGVKRSTLVMTLPGSCPTLCKQLAVVSSLSWAHSSSPSSCGPQTAISLTWPGATMGCISCSIVTGLQRSRELYVDSDVLGSVHPKPYSLIPSPQTPSPNPDLLGCWACQKAILQLLMPLSRCNASWHSSSSPSLHSYASHSTGFGKP